MHRQHRPLKPNIPYNKNFAFQKAAAQLCAAAFFALRFRIELLLQLPFSVTFPPVKRQVWKIRRFSRPVNNLSACYVQISAATVYTAL